jgi:hypothetical protein
MLSLLFDGLVKNSNYINYFFQTFKRKYINFLPTNNTMVYNAATAVFVRSEKKNVLCTMDTSIWSVDKPIHQQHGDAK